MRSSTSVLAAIRAALVAAGVQAVDGPADELARTPDGLIAQFAVLWPLTPQHQYTRLCAGRSGRVDGVTVQCGGASAGDALAVVDKVESALGGLRLPGGGVLLPSPFSAGGPLAEPNSDPVRVYMSVEYSVVTKG